MHSIRQDLEEQLSSAVKMKLFRACVESTLLYSVITWTLTDTLSRNLNGCYTKLLRYALNHKWSDYVPNSGLEFVSIRILEKQLSFAGHCILWEHTKVVNCKSAKGASNAKYSRQLLKAILRVDGLVTGDEEVRRLMLDREAWRNRIKMIKAANKEVDSSKRADRKSRRTLKLELPLCYLV
jgi:hypothetical protein